MDTVTVSFTALPGHVRTARFIAASVARRAGVSEGLLDEIRLAVSEACSLAVRQHGVFAPTVAVELTMTERDTTFSVRVADAVARQRPDDATDDLLQLSRRDPIVEPNPANPANPANPVNSRGTRDVAVQGEWVVVGNVAVADLSAREEDELIGSLQARERIGLAVISGLVDDVLVDYGPDGAAVTMTWPLGNAAVGAG